MNLLQLLALLKSLFDQADEIQEIIRKAVEAWNSKKPQVEEETSVLDCGLSEDELGALLDDVTSNHSEAYNALVTQYEFSARSGDVVAMPQAAAIGDGKILKWLVENKDLILLLINLLKK